MLWVSPDTTAAEAAGRAWPGRSGDRRGFALCSPEDSDSTTLPRPPRLSHSPAGGGLGRRRPCHSQSNSGRGAPLGLRTWTLAPAGPGRAGGGWRLASGLY